MVFIASASEFKKPTVGEVLKLINRAADIKGFDPKKVNRLLGIGERTVRSWVSKAEIEPDSRSAIPFWAFNLIYAMAEKEPLLQPLQHITVDNIDSSLLMSASTYQCPSNQTLLQFVGKNSITGLTRSELAKKLGCDSNWLSVQINDSKLSFGTYANLLLLCGIDQALILQI